MDATPYQVGAQFIGAPGSFWKRLDVIGGNQLAGGVDGESRESQSAVEIGAHRLEPFRPLYVTRRQHGLAHEFQDSPAVLRSVLPFYEGVVQPDPFG